jgi:hypothetical protein
MQEYVAHEYADIFPMLSESDIRELADNIKTRGLIEPIVLLDGKILDGRNRYEACRRAAVRPRFIEFDGATAPPGAIPFDPLAYVLSKNLHRRHLSESQRAMVAAKLATMKRGRPEENAPIGANTQGAAAEQLQVGRRSVQRAREVIEHGADELREAVESGEVSVSAAAAIARTMTPDEQTAIVSQGREAVKAAATEQRIKRSREVNGAYENATKALVKWREKWAFLGDEELDIIYREVFNLDFRLRHRRFDGARRDDQL